MTSVRWLVLATTLLCPVLARAEEFGYIARGAPSEVQATVTLGPASQIGPITFELLALARHGKGLGTGDAPLPKALAEPPARLVSGETAILPEERVASRLVRARFRIGPELKRLKVLRLRARYLDGLVCAINGKEVVRRHIEPAAGATAFAQRAHGPEWETFGIPIRGGLLEEGENVLALEVRPGAFRRFPELYFELIGADKGRIVRGPMVSRVAQDGASIVFETDLATTAEVHFRTSAGQAGSVASRERGTRHVVAISGVPADTQVTYQVVTPDDRSPEWSFHTAPPKGDVVRFVVYGDVRSGHDVHEQVVESILTDAPDFVVGTGDMVYRGTDDADWQRFFDIAGDLLGRIPVYPAAGNHDVGAADGDRMLEDMFLLWPGPKGRPRGAAWYSFDVADVHFVVLDSNRYDDPNQLAWLEEDLRRVAPLARAIFAITHHGPFSRGPHGGHPLAQGAYVPMLEKYRTRVLFAGHDHLYQRGRVGDLTYVVSGGGGAPLYPIQCGGRGRARCEQDGADVAVSEHHYVVVEVFRDSVRLCPRRPDGTPLEPCVTLR
ncbi:MAG: metallophosphoesterase [Deltaproteobacteria bacterium]|nr:metallophosphoesterase [Deltaproteobacteria bacterium]